jgi:hypothetical protein
MNFSELLSNDQRKEVLQNRILGFTVEAYQVSLNAKIAEKVGDEEGAAQAANSLRTLEIAIQVYTEEMSTII